MKPITKEKLLEIEEFLTKGERNKSGRKGYVVLKLNKNGKERRMKRSRAYYQYFNRIELNPFDIIHHRDGNKENDDIRNLDLITTEEHITLHHAGKRKV